MEAGKTFVRIGEAALLATGEGGFLSGTADAGRFVALTGDSARF